MLHRSLFIIILFRSYIEKTRLNRVFSSALLCPCRDVPCPFSKLVPLAASSAAGLGPIPALICAAYLLFFSGLVARDIPVCCGHLITQNAKQEVWSGGTRWHQICSPRWLMVPVERMSVTWPRTECFGLAGRISAVRQCFHFPSVSDLFLVPLSQHLSGVLCKTWKAVRCGRTRKTACFKMYVFANAALQ